MHIVHMCIDEQFDYYGYIDNIVCLCNIYLSKVH